MKIKPRESDVQRAIMDYCAAMRIPCFRRNTGAVVASYGGKKRMIRFSAVGMADLWGWYPKTGRHWECEVKREGEKPSEAQARWLEESRSTNAVAFWCDSLESFIAQF